MKPFSTDEMSFKFTAEDFDAKDLPYGQDLADLANAKVEPVLEALSCAREALRKSILFSKCVIGKEPEEINYRYLNEAREALATIDKLMGIGK